MNSEEKSKQELAEEHSFIKDAIFRLKASVLIAKRFVENSVSSTKKFKKDNQLINESVVAFSESDLWNPDDNDENWILTAGKIENLRITAEKLNGIEVKANQVFSFWKHIGNPNFGKGYVVGREIREGCVIPTIAGGLCQISNALYDTALNANFNIVERHKHTKVIKGSLAEKDRDATVKWNYVDLQFKSSFDFRIEIELSADKLIVTFKSIKKNIKSSENQFNSKYSDKINDCYSCGNSSCYKHPERSSINQEIATTTYLLDEKWEEYNQYIKENTDSSDTFIIPYQKTNSWSVFNPKKTRKLNFQSILRTIQFRIANKKGKNPFETSLILDEKLAVSMAKKIPIDATHLVISQNLLPFLYKKGVLGGRTYDVLMTRLPLKNLQNKLDEAFKKFPNSPTLKDFRASEAFVNLEIDALHKASKIITPHSEIAKIYKDKVVKLNWNIPKNSSILKGKKVLFPASAVGRKGAYEIKQLQKELNFDLVISGNAIEYNGFWEDLQVEKFSGNFSEIALVVYPTYIENQPRLILKAISFGIPVISTKNSGIEGIKNVKTFYDFDYEELKKEVKLNLINSK